MRAKHAVVVVVVAAVIAAAAIGPDRLSIAYGYAATRLHGGHTVEDRLAQFGSAARQRMAPAFAAASMPYPPQRVALVAFKDSRQLSLFAQQENGGWRYITTHPITAASGTAGPKLREGDHQVPEGIYRVTFLNPSSLYHVSLRLDYPNAFDRRVAAADARSNLGGDIMIHGKAVSIGCIAVGDPAAEELFTLAADIGQANVEVLIVPTDLRISEPVRTPDSPRWINELYAELSRRLNGFPSPRR